METLMKMKIMLLVLCLFASAPFLTSQSNVFETQVAAKMKPCKFLTVTDAEKIIGQPVRLTENTSKIEGSVRKSGCTYRGISKDKLSGKDINLYFSLEQQVQNPSVEKAQREFASSYQKVDEPLLLVELLSAIGDEAFVISNTPHFHFIMVRKGGTIFRMKLNKAPEKNSLSELKAFAKKFAEKF